MTSPTPALGGFVGTIVDGIIGALFEVFQFFVDTLQYIVEWFSVLVGSYLADFVEFIVSELPDGFEEMITEDVWTDVFPFIQFAALVYPFPETMSIFVASISIVAGIRFIRYLLGFIPGVEA